MIRVVQWATGNVGRHAVRAIQRDPNLELVGARVYGADKAGKDVGEICGLDPMGVIATTDVDEIVALDADCVLYMAQGEMDPEGALTDICRLLASGKNVVSTAVTAFIYPKCGGPELVDRLEAACAEGATSFHGTGIEPGWAGEVLPLTMSGILFRTESILVQELMDYSTYDSKDMMFDIMGFGLAPDADCPMADESIVAPTFKAPIMLLADGLGADQAPDWPTGRGWRVTIEGEPSMTLDSRIAVNGEDDTEQGCLGTAMHAVHAIVPVCVADPGIRTFLDLPMITGRGILS